MADPAGSVQIDDPIDVSRLADEEIGEGIPRIPLLADEPRRLSRIKSKQPETPLHVPPMKLTNEYW